MKMLDLKRLLNPTRDARLIQFGVLAAAMLSSGCALWDASNGSADDPADTADIIERDTSGEEPDAAGADAQNNDTGDVAADADVAVESSVFDGCLSSGTSFQVNPSESTPQSQQRVAFDGEALWVVYIQVAQLVDIEPLKSDVYAARISCEGAAMQTSMIKLNTGDPAVYTRPSIDIIDETVHIVWNAEEPRPNMRGAVAYRSLSIDGEPKMANEVFIDFQLVSDGLGGATNFSYADIVAISDSEAIVAATSERDSRYYTILQRIDDQGDAIADVVEAPSDSSQWVQLRPSITATEMGKIWVAWLEPSVSGNDAYQIHYAGFRGEDLIPIVTKTIDSPNANSVGPRFSTGIADDQHLFLVQQTSDLQTRFYNIAQESNLGTVPFEGNDTYPTVASAREKGAVAWFRRATGDQAGQRHITARPFDDTSTGVTMGPTFTVATVTTPALGALPGRAEIVSVGDDSYFVVAQDGRTLASTRLHAYFVDLPWSE